MSLRTRLVAEAFGTGWLVLLGCGSAVLWGDMSPGIGAAGVSLAFGLAVLTAAYVFGPVSGCHINPAVSIGLWAAKRFSGKDLGAYIFCQVIGAIAGAGVLYVIASGKPGFKALGFASTGYGEHSPGGYALGAGILTEVVFTFVLVMIVLGSTDRRAPRGLAPVTIGLGVTLLCLVGIPVTGMSLNPARSTGSAVMAGDWALAQLWLFWAGPIVGGFLAGIVYPILAPDASRPEPAEEVEALKVG